MTKAFRFEEINAFKPSKMINANIKKPCSSRLNMKDTEEFRKFIICQCEKSEQPMHIRYCSVSKMSSAWYLVLQNLLTIFLQLQKIDAFLNSRSDLSS